MADLNYRFPDEEDDEEIKNDTELEIEVVDDVPEQDRNIEPLPKHMVEKLEHIDEEEDYSDKVKNKFKQFKKIYHDERRLKESAQRENMEAINLAKKVLEENKKLKALLQSGEEELLSTYKSSAELEVDKARRLYKEAYDSGDTEAIVEAQQELIKANVKLDKAKDFRPTMQDVGTDYELPETQTSQPADPKVAAWVSRNKWFTDPSKKVMAKYAMAYHQNLAEAYGPQFVGSDEYYSHIDNEMRKRFPEEFSTQSNENSEEPPEPKQSRKPTVVAPVKRSTAPKKITLTASQMRLTKTLGITPEQYIEQLRKIEETENG